MKKKIILLILIVLMLCGCKAEVNVEINDTNTISESVDITAYQNNNYTKEQIKNSFRNYLPAYAEDVIVDTNPDEQVSGVSYYKKTETDLDTGYKINYSYNFNFSNYAKARTVKEGFKSSTIQVNSPDKTILISTDSNGLLYFSQYPDLEEVKVNIKTKYKVKENNADSVNNNVYTWVFNNSTNNKGIYLLLDTTSTIDSDEDETKKTNTTTDLTTEKSSNETMDIIKDFMNKHPFISVFIGIGVFFIVLFIASKFKKI